MSPRLPQLEQQELSLIEKRSSVDDISELHQSVSSTAMKDQADKDDPFQLRLPQLSVPLARGEQTGISIKFGQRALDGQPLAKIIRGSFGNVRINDRFDDVDVLSRNEKFQLSFGKSVMQTVPDADKGCCGVLGRQSNIESIFT